jgi:hypothetical protein
MSEYDSSEWGVPGEGVPRRRATNRMKDLDWEEAPDLTGISEDELRRWLELLSEEEWEISYRRRVLQGRIDLIRAEIVRRGGVAFSPEELARVLLGNQGSEGRGSLPGRGGGG